MKTYYFASFVETWDAGFFEVAVFEDKETRDKWVSFQDRGSIMSGETEDNCQLHRMPIDGVEAEGCYKMIDICDREDDLLNDNMFWIT